MIGSVGGMGFGFKNEAQDVLMHLTSISPTTAPFSGVITFSGHGFSPNLGQSPTTSMLINFKDTSTGLVTVSIGVYAYIDVTTITKANPLVTPGIYEIFLIRGSRRTEGFLFTST